MSKKILKINSLAELEPKLSKRIKNLKEPETNIQINIGKSKIKFRVKKI